MVGLICEACDSTFDHARKVRFCKNDKCISDRTTARYKKWYDKEGSRLKLNEYQQKYRTRTGYGRDYELRTKYGINLQQWIDMLESAGNVCELCGEAKENLCVDHDHATNKVRGVLCRKCNRALGQLGDTLEVAQRLVAYLSR